MKTKSDELAQRVQHKHGNIVEESSSRESAFATKISDLQMEIKQLKKIEKNMKQEIELGKQQYATLHTENQQLLEKKQQLSYESKELKVKESRFNDEYNMLEEENTLLQKAVSKLKQTLVEFEGLKVENKSLLDEVMFFLCHPCRKLFIFLITAVDLLVKDMYYGMGLTFLCLIHVWLLHILYLNLIDYGLELIFFKVNLLFNHSPPLVCFDLLFTPQPSISDHIV